MEDKDKSKDQLLEEIVQLRHQIEELKSKQEPLPQNLLQESKEKYMMLTDSIVEGVVIIDFRGKVLYCNESAAKMVGFKDPSEGIGKNVFKFIVPQSRKAAITDLWRVYRGEWGFLTTYRAKGTDKKQFWVDTLGRRITYKGKVAELIVFRDVTERLEMEEALKSEKDKLEESVRERTHELTEANKQLLRLFKETVGALASALEAKDPYTAGHQQRVAQLACLVGEEIGLSENQIEGLHMAALVHDIGKIHVPVEILTKPGQLTETELKMINTHPEYGYEILKEIEFPWPIAEMVRQHHEKLNGTGYPLGLKEKDILPEAKILAVADAVESMATHRPYRPALGIDRALERIKAGRGVHYDIKVVDACIKIFSEQHFNFNLT